MPAGRALEIRFSVVRKRGPEVARRRRRSGIWIRVRAMSRAGHSDCQGGLSAVQTQRGDDSCAQIAVIRRRLANGSNRPEAAVLGLVSGCDSSAGSLPINSPPQCRMILC